MPAPIPQSGEIVLNNVRFKLARPIIERSIDQFPAKIVQGDTRLRDQTLASEWVFIGDLTDGSGIKHHVPGEHDRRFWSSEEVVTKYRNRIFNNVAPGNDTSTGAAIVWLGELGTSNYVYALEDTKIYRRTGTAPWSTALRVTSSGGKSMSQYKGNLYAWFTSFYEYSTDGEAFAKITEPGVYAVEFDNLLVKIDAAGVMKWTTADPADAVDDWLPLNGGISLVPNTTIQGMVVWRDQHGDPAIIIGTTHGAYILDYYNERVYPFYLFKYTDPYHCRAMAVWNQDLYISTNRSLLRFTGTAVIRVWPPLDGVRANRQGRITDLLCLQHSLLMSMDNAAITARRGVISSYNGNGWHNELGTTDENVAFESIAWSNNIMTVAQSGDEVFTRRMNFTDTTENPLDTGHDAWIGDGLLYSPYFDAGMPNIDKLALAVVGDVRDITIRDPVTDKLTFSYSLNDADNWATDLAVVNASGEFTKNFGTSNVGIKFRNISMRTRIQMSGTVMPYIIHAKLRYMVIPNELYAYQFSVDCSAGTGDSSPEELRAALVAAKDSETLVTLIMPDPPQTVTGRVAEITGERNAGLQGGNPGVYAVRFVQPV